MTKNDLSRIPTNDLAALLVFEPARADLHRQMFERCHAEGDELAALAHLIAAKAIEIGDTASAENLYLVATGYFMKGDYVIAEQWYALVLQLGHDKAEIHQNRVVIHTHFGRLAEAEISRARAYAMQRIFIERAEHAVRRLLILCVGRSNGNIPYEVLLSTQTSERIKYMIDYASELEDATLPAFDLIFNAIGEPDVAAPLEDRLAGFLRGRATPLLNHPDTVARTSRDRLPALVADLDTVTTASCIRLDPGMELAPVNGLQFPLLYRPLASHGGQGLALCENREQLRVQRAAGQKCYLTNFIDFKSADGYYRKYRVIFVDRQPYPYHLAIGNTWMVHYYTTDMLEQDWKMAEERRFMEDPASALGTSGLQALREIGQRLDLDYAGIDFTVLPDGTLFVFEANATMLVHRVSLQSPVAYKNSYVQQIIDAFEALLVRLSAGSAEQ